MTTNQFHNALLQGRGSCVLAAMAEPEKFREDILWACRELISFDTQCEGSRAWLLYELISLYSDREPFLQAACDALIACPSLGDWHLDTLAELLEYLSQDGSERAWDTLMRKYRMLYHQMLKIGPPEGYWAARDDYEHLCVILATCREYCFDLARDMGRLSLETEWLRDWTFDWFYAAKAEKYLRSMIKAAQRDALLAEFLRVHTPRESASQPRRRNKLLSRWNATPERVEEACQCYRSAVTEAEKAEALDAFRIYPYPGDPKSVIADVKLEHKALRSSAWRALRNIKHPAVREFSLRHLFDEDEAFHTFCTNYEPRDEAILMERLLTPDVDFESNTTWHGDQMAVLDMKKPPKAALRYIFDTTFCSCCRFHTLEEMGRRRMLTLPLLEECRFDANDDIRAYARRALKRRAKR